MERGGMGWECPSLDVALSAVGWAQLGLHDLGGLSKLSDSMTLFLCRASLCDSRSRDFIILCAAFPGPSLSAEVWGALGTPCPGAPLFPQQNRQSQGKCSRNLGMKPSPSKGTTSTVQRLHSLSLPVQTASHRGINHSSGIAQLILELLAPLPSPPEQGTRHCLNHLPRSSLQACTHHLAGEQAFHFQLPALSLFQSGPNQIS